MKPRIQKLRNQETMIPRNQQPTNQETLKPRHQETKTLFEVRESPAPINIPTPTLAVGFSIGMASNAPLMAVKTYLNGN